MYLYYWETFKKWTATTDSCYFLLLTLTTFWLLHLFGSWTKDNTWSSFPHLSSPSCGQHLVHKQEHGCLWRQADAFPDYVHELGHCQVSGQQILPLVNVHNVWARDLLQSDLTNHTQQRLQPSASTPRGQEVEAKLTGTRSGYLLRISVDRIHRFSRAQWQTRLLTTLQKTGSKEKSNISSPLKSLK